MHTLARPLVRAHRLHRQSSSRAFTLIELLTVIGIIAILSAITFGIVKGVNERAAIGQAKTELSSLAQALEAYKTLYGDYPQTTDKAVFFQSIIGKYGPKGASASITGRRFIDTNRFSLNAPTTPDDAANYLLDPWGRAYLYYYYTISSGSVVTKRGYVLYSVGPDNANTAPSVTGTSAGFIDTAATGNADNIYANN